MDKMVGLTSGNLIATKTPTSSTTYADNRYVVVLPFSAKKSHVLLIKKNKPDYLRGKYNGPGGKIEQEDYVQGPHLAAFYAARREMLEETGIDLWREDLEHIIHMTFYPSPAHKERNEPLLIDFIAVFSDMIFRWKQMEDEQPATFLTDGILDSVRSRIRLVGNLYWMIPFALDKHRSAAIHCEEVLEQ